jgi:hypothetical protein
MLWPVVFLTLLTLFLPDPLAAQAPGPFFLRVEGGEERKLLLEFPVRSGEFFYFHYIHSSDQTPIRDTFRIGEEGKIILVEEAFLWYGAGLEFQAHGDVRVSHADRWTRVRLYRPFSSLPIRVGRIAEQTLIVQGQSIRLDQIGKPGECLTLSLFP